MRLLVCAGMTGGGVYPAIAVLQALEGSADEVLWIGSQSGMEKTLLKSYKLSYQSIPAAGLHGVDLRTLPGNLGQLFKGWCKARKIVRQFKPDVMFFTGGYLGVPVVLAGRHIPSVVFVPDIEPGMALKAILRSAHKIAVNCEETLGFLRTKDTLVSGYPLRREMVRWNRKEARAHFGIPEKENLLLVFGGSKGAQSINRALFACLPSLLPDMHVIHISGRDNWSETESFAAGLKGETKSRYHPFAFLHDDMGAAFAAADLVVCRSGASTLGELPHFSLPAILVPYPYAWRYQRQNADHLAHGGAAVILEDDRLENQLETRIREIINDRAALEKMRSAMHNLATPHAAENIADLILSVANRATGGDKW